MNERFIKYVSGLLATTTLLSGSVVTLAEGNNNLEDAKDSSIKVDGEMLSQNAIEDLGVTVPGEDKASVKVTPEYRASFKEQFQDLSIPAKELKEMADNIRQDWILEHYGPYIDKAKSLGLTDEDEIWFTAKEFFTYENAPSLGPGTQKYQKYINQEDIAIYALTGEDKDVIKYEGSSLCRLVMPNFTEKGKERLRRIVPAAISRLEDEGINIVDSIKNGSAVVFYVDELQPETGYGAGLTGEWGVWNMNLSEENIRSVSDEDLINEVAKIFRGETFGIDCDQLLKSLEIFDFYGVSAISNPLIKNRYNETIKYNYIGKEFIATGDKDFIIFGDNLLAYANKNIKDYDLSIELINRLGELVEVVLV